MIQEPISLTAAIKQPLKALGRDRRLVQTAEIKLMEISNKLTLIFRMVV
jgi:hypothetical protein